MSLHISAQPDAIAETVLVSGDPLRAKFIAENMFEQATCYNEVRNMLGYTGEYNGKRVSVQGTGMGQPSLAIYLHELIHSYGVKKVIRIGTCGALREDINLGEVIFAQGASTDSSINKQIFNGLDFAPTPDFYLLEKAREQAKTLNIETRVGGIFSTDLFYFENDPERWKVWIDHGILCAEMETSCLYTMAAKHDISALSILTVSDNILTGEASSAEKREKAFHEMVAIALGCI